MTGKPIIRTNATPTVMRIVPELAQEIGLNESIMLLQISHYISISNHYKDGDYWTYQSVRDLQEKAFPFWSIATINRTINSLEEKGLIKVGNYNQAKFDKTRWLALDTDNVAELTSVTLVYQNDTRVMQNDTRTAQNETTIPETTTETTAEREVAEAVAGQTLRVVEPPHATLEEVSEAIYDTVTPAIAQRILELPTHLKRSRLQGIRIPLVDAFGEAMNSAQVPSEQDKVRALEATIAGYTPDDMKALVKFKHQNRAATAPTYCLKWALDDLPSFKAKATPAPLPRYRTMSEPDEPPTLSVMSEEDRQHALNLIAARKARMAQESADATEKAS